MKKLDGFNLAQSDAILTPSDIDVIISAGAGSGKTKTLKEKVFRLISEGIIKPSEILVLTFTNNAAHEMKERIVKAFEGNAKAQEMLSAHIQTFDSFSQYLVSTYASELKIASSISIADKSTIEAKKLALLDEIFFAHYKDPQKRARLVESLKKFDMQDDSTFKRYVLDLLEYLEKLTPQKRLDFRAHYMERFTGQEFADDLVAKLVEHAKTDIRIALRKAFFLQRHGDLELSENVNFASYQAAFDDKTVFALPIGQFAFEDDQKTLPLYEALLGLLQLEGREFVDKVCTFEADNPELLKKPSKKKDDEDYERRYLPFQTMRILLATKNCTLAYVKSVAANLDSDHIDSFIPDIELLFELCEELETRLLDYKKATNSFLFADIANMALSLLTEPQFEVVAEKIRSRFQFIMVDEYQDTNDFQELFIDSLSAPRKDGTRAHLFFVGDAKQAIYAFRNSNVALFRARQAQYSDGDPAHKAIAMNMNYRSGKKLLSDINHIFSYYMRLDHGSISYRDPMERLDYDEDVNIYGKPFDNFGISRIVSTTGKGDDGVDPMEWECSAIIADIKKKIAEGYLVYDRNCKERIRPCTYGDFCILMRKKAQFEYYQKRFQEEGVPLNCSVSILLREVNSIILLQSLFTLLDAKINGTPCDENHLFASIARSYAYRYEDSYLFGLIHSGSISEDPLMKQIEEFAKKHRDDGLEMLFPAVCEEFHVISQLYRIGGVADAIDKIDSIAALARALASSGEGLREFAKLLHEIDKFDLDIKAEAESKSENAVDLMTIHGSKGLERKIVYMPESINCIAKGIAAKNLLAIDGQYGIMLPDYSFSSFDFAPHPVYGAAYALWKKENSSNADADEHVRLFYVALTRAENSVIFVGDDLGKTEDIYAMISCAPNYYEINADFAKIALSKHIVAEALFRQNKTLDEIRKRQEEIVFPPCVDEDSAKTFNELIIYFFGERLQKRMDDCLGCIEQAIFTHYLPHLESVSDSDLLARIYAYYQFSNPSIGSLQELNAYISALITRKKANGEAEEDSGIDDGLKPVLASDLVAFRQAIVELDLPYFHMKLKSDVKKSEEEAARLAMMAKTFASSLVFAFEGFPKFAQRSFSTSSFEDKVAIFDYTAFSSSSKGSFPAPPSLAVDDEEIRFPLIVKTRASKTLASVDEEAKRYALDQGIELHRCMEIVDLRTKDTSFIPNPMYRKMITRALQMDCFASLEGAEIYKEYGFFDSELGSMGYIDLLIIRDGKYEIIDYKTRKISDPAYDEQLRNYARNVARLFGVKQEDIKLTLVSLAEGKTRQVAP